MLSIDEINDLQRKNELNIKQYNSLLKQYNNTLKVMKKQEEKYTKVLLEIKEAALNSIRFGSFICGGWLEQKIDEVLND